MHLLRDSVVGRFDVKAVEEVEEGYYSYNT